MALEPKLTYPGQILTSDPAYPLGKARNVAVPGDGTGTPWEALLVNDLFGFQQAMLDEAGLTATNVPDKVGASQYLDALKLLFEAAGAGRDLQSWLGAPSNAINNDIEPRGMAWQEKNLVWMVAGFSDEAMISHDDGATWTDASSGMTDNIGLVDIAHSRANDIWLAVGDDDTAYSRTGISGAWGTTLLPGGSTVNIQSIVYDPSADLFIAIGRTSGPIAAWIATAPGGSLTWTLRTANVTATFTDDILESHAVSESGVSVISAASAAKTKLMRSTDGITWADITSVLVSDTYTVGYNPKLDKFLAYGTSLGNIYTSSDGDTWVLVGPAALPLNAQSITHERSVGSLGGIWVIGGNIGNIGHIFFAPSDADLTVTGWRFQKLSPNITRLNSVGFGEDGLNGKVLAGFEPLPTATVLGSLRALPMR